LHKTHRMKITKTTLSRLAETDFNNLAFGRTFSDHMLMCKYKDGQWEEAEILPYQALSFAPGTHVFHYGQAVFEGMKAYNGPEGETLLFRPEANIHRLNQSAERLCMPAIDKSIFMEGLKTLLAIDKEWIPKGAGKSLYIRPFMMASSEFIRATPADEFVFFIITSPSSAYYSGEVHLKVEEKYARSVDGGTGFAKAAGNYAAAFAPTKKAQNAGFTQVIWTDAHEHQYIEESGTMNIMFRINDTLITPALSDSILSGITRDSILKLARNKGITVEERKVSVKEIFEAHSKGELKEAFGVGTAVTVNPINSITKGEHRIDIASVSDSYATLLKDSLQGMQYGRIADGFGWIKRA
jgi:branched-chain amino acid aminotransferase